MTVPLIRPAVAMFRVVVFFRMIAWPPILTCREGPSVRKTILAGTCSDNPNRFAAYPPEGCNREASRSDKALATCLGPGESKPMVGCCLGKS